ncbi:uncharacterized protein LOC129723155 isoform X2 [Wyeomyia smithii]|uniref:uncharacterized protein LOC129723155 isoform X2 n=1 Tax=Wyeomyia smithii TaxID=174621 RepID=UPI002467EA23|nr:uncharacterized protein LOC129723155 isoform X2 [Wyeomyia smithii]
MIINMNGESKNESFKLLQLSDDSKSFSDLELPDMTTQRKRKVRRKTRPRTASTIRHGDDRTGSHIDCRNFGLWLAVLMTVLWLFIISYITSVVHHENRRLEIAIQKVSATSHNVPEALQKWHETSKTLEQNQTALNGKLRDIQQVLSNFSTELKQLRETIEKKNENSQEAQFNSLMTNVANLGSQIKDALARITSLEDRYTKAQSEQKTLEKSLGELQIVFAEIRNGSTTASMVGNNVNNITEQSIANIRDQLSTQISNLAQNFTGELETLKQKNAWLVDDLKTHKTSIDDLLESSANISSHVKSVENIWVEMKTNLNNLEGSGKQVNEQIELLQNVTNTLKGSLGTVREECAQYHSQNDAINSEITVIKERLEKAERREVPTTVSTVNPTESQKGSIPKNLSQLFNNPPTETTLPKATQAAANSEGVAKPMIQKDGAITGASPSDVIQQPSAVPSPVSSSPSTTLSAGISKTPAASGM